MDFRKTITLSMIITGATAMASQIVFMREFLVVFYGNEISIGIILASWLVWGAFGSALLGSITDRIKARVLMFSLCQLSLALILPASFLFIRLSKPLMGITTGELVGYGPMMVSTFLMLAAPCAVMGFMFSLACRIYRDSAGYPAGSVARIYVMEALGGLAGGLLVSYVLIRFIYAFEIVFLLFFLNMLACLLTQRYAEGRFLRKFIRIFAVLAVAAGVAAVFTGADNSLREYSLGKLWSGFNVLESTDSVYGNITVTERGSQRSFYDNALHLYTVPDRLYAEESVHFAMLEDGDPEDILLIGGGIGGLLEEALKYPVESVDYVELDPVLVEMARRHLSKDDSSWLDRPEVSIINADGRFYVKRTGKKYDCVIISLGDPYTAQLNRFYTVGFFRELAGIMKKGAVVSFGLTSSENYISGELQDYLRSIYLSLKEVFPEVIIIPGDTAYFIASNESGILTVDVAELMRRLKDRDIETVYVREYYLFDKLSPERMGSIRRAVEGGADVRENRDFKPVSYYYATVFWGTQFDAPFFRKMLRAVSPHKIWVAASAFCSLIIVFALVSGKRRSRRTVLLSVMTTGFAEIIFQIAVLISFQVIYGYVFYKLGVIITSFMVGLAIGGWLIARYMPRIKDDMALFRWTQVSICIYPLILPVVFLWLSRAEGAVSSWLGSNVIFPFLPVVAGVIGGIQFPLANKMYLEDRERLGAVAGLSYGLDLLGACAGSFLAAAFFVPVLGIFQTCFLAALVNLTVMAALLLNGEASGARA